MSIPKQGHRGQQIHSDCWERFIAQAVNAGRLSGNLQSFDFVCLAVCFVVVVLGGSGFEEVCVKVEYKGWHSGHVVIKCLCP